MSAAHRNYSLIKLLFDKLKLFVMYRGKENYLFVEPEGEEIFLDFYLILVRDVSRCASACID